MTLSGPEARQLIEATRRSTEPVDLSGLVHESERDAWTMADDTLRFIAGLISRLRPSMVLEFGSGLSTRVAGSACARLDEAAKVVSLENDPVFERRTRADLAGHGLDGLASVELVHLVVRRWYERQLPVYDLPTSVLDHPPPQLVLVDGPPMPLGGRKGALLQALHLGDAGTIVLLDDADRAGEQEAIALADKVVGDHIEIVQLEGFAKGLAAVVVRSPVGGSAMPGCPAASGVG